MDAARHLSEDRQLTLSLPDDRVQAAHAVLVGLPKLVVVPHRRTILSSDGKIFAIANRRPYPFAIN
jgi:hypothetical protein